MEYHFSVQDVVALSHKSSGALNGILVEREIYLPKRILSYALSQQIMIQISSERELMHLRGIGPRLENYTLHQLMQFIISQSINIDTKDYKYRLWTVVLSNSLPLQISNEDVKHLSELDSSNEYLHDIISTLTQFVDGPYDLDGQSILIGKESLSRHASTLDIIEIAELYSIEIPSKTPKADFIEMIQLKVDDNSLEFTESLQEMSYEELEQFAKDNYVKDSGELSPREATELLLSQYEAPDHHITEIEFKDFLEVPSISDSDIYLEDEDLKFEVSEEVSNELKTMIDSILSDSEEEISEEEAAKELEKIMNYLPGSDISYLNKRIEQLEMKLDHTNTLLMNQLVSKVSDLEKKIKKPMKLTVSKNMKLSLIIWFITSLVLSGLLYLNHII